MKIEFFLWCQKLPLVLVCRFIHSINASENYLEIDWKLSNFSPKKKNQRKSFGRIIDMDVLMNVEKVWSENNNIWDEVNVLSKKN